jgi:hypothetical protein
MLPTDAVIDVVPARMAVMRPPWTLATCGLELVQVTVAPGTCRPSRVRTLDLTVVVLPDVSVTDPLADNVTVAGELSGGGGADPPSPPPPHASVARVATQAASSRKERFSVGICSMEVRRHGAGSDGAATLTRGDLVHKRIPIFVSP